MTNSGLFHRAQILTVLSKIQVGELNTIKRLPDDKKKKAHFKTIKWLNLHGVREITEVLSLFGRVIFC